jgi:hypothetical protein
VLRSKIDRHFDPTEAEAAIGGKSYLQRIVLAAGSLTKRDQQAIKLNQERGRLCCRAATLGIHLMP